MRKWQMIFVKNTMPCQQLIVWHLWHKNNGKINEISFAKQGYALVGQWYNA
jgi:hypothetical protein